MSEIEIKSLKVGLENTYRFIADQYVGETTKIRDFYMMHAFNLIQFSYPEKNLVDLYPIILEVYNDMSRS